jgi:hypothetical protein
LLLKKENGAEIKYKIKFKLILIKLYTLFVANIYKFCFRFGLILVRFSRGDLTKQTVSLSSKKLNIKNEDYKIVITTFSKRFFSDCLPLIKELRNAGINQEIIIGVNGDFESHFNQGLRKDFLGELSKFEGISPVCFSTFRGLSVVWNRSIQSGDAEITVVLNDDLIVNRQTVASTLDDIVNRATIDGICLLNLSWSHFAIKSKVFQDIGWFDERLLGIGEEDSDMTFRFESFYGFTPPSISSDGFIHDSSYEFDLKIKPGKGKYSLFNWIFIEKKYSFGRGTQSRMFDLPAVKVINDLELYPAENWRLTLQRCLLMENRNEIDTYIENIGIND